MTEKRFTDNGIEDIENQSFTDNLTGKTYWIDNGLDEIVDLLNAFNDDNEQLKKELQRIYDVATLNKAIEVLENKYDKMLYDGSDEIKDAMRHTVLRCIEDLDELKDDITAR